MKIAILSNSDAFFPLAYALLGQQISPSIFYSPSPDSHTNQQVIAFVSQAGVNFTEEKQPDKDLYNWLTQGNYDVCFVVGYKHLIDIDRLKNCPTPIFNIHFGPLPAYRGATPVFWQLKNGEQNIGLCIHSLSQKFDDGPVVWLKETTNLPHYNYRSVNLLFNQLCVEGVFYILQLIINKLPIPLIQRDGIRSSYQKRPGLNEVTINWQQMDAAEICNLIRAGNPWNKGAITFFNGQEIKLMDAIVIANEAQDQKNAEPGSITVENGQLNICCRDGNSIQVNMLFYNECYIPEYQCMHWGFLTGKKLG